MELPVGEQFADDFVQYWALLAELVTDTAKVMLDRSFDNKRIDGLTRGLRTHHRKNLRRTPGAIRRLRRLPTELAQVFARREIILSPVLAHTTPPLGHIAPTVEYDELIERLRRYVAYTPLNNIAGTPAISLPLGMSDDGLPVGVQLSGAYGDERTLLELAYALEAEFPFARIQD
jgi:amidase